MSSDFKLVHILELYLFFVVFRQSEHKHNKQRPYSNKIYYIIY